jgi:serine/threonine protein kinase/tetratricopeptide (TPR) repeat protein
MSEETLFHEALARPPAARAAFLDAACVGQPQLRAAVEALLAAHERPGLVLDQPPLAVGQAVAPAQAPDRPLATGQYFPDPPAAPAPSVTTDYQPPAAPGVGIAGRYTLQERIGEGGMGEVWVAKQTEPVKRRVAVKLIKAGMDTRAVLQRFEAERQALALMDHPNIARVLDGGMTTDRRPFFVMELVNGLPLTKFCDDAKLGIRERLALFVAVCQAVQHAHQKGIVHRDLKPSNILVTLIDGAPVPKVIDFGVAKAIGGKLLDESLSTQFGAVLGTLEYMAPEQASFSGSDIDTRADIYSLGVVLYELLTGLRPIDDQRLRKAAVSEMARILQEEEPYKPSTRLSTNEALPSLAALRQTEPRRLLALLRGELDWVVMKCLEKQRDCRYETANGLARDIQRYLADEPVEARPPSAAYQLGKFLRRNKGPVLAASVVLLALLLGMTGTTWGLIRAARANDALAAANMHLSAANAKVEARYNLSVEAIKTFHTGVSEDFLLKQDQFKELRDRLLKSAADFYGKLSTLLGKETSFSSRHALAQSNFELAELTSKIGRTEDALAAHRAVLADREILANEPEADVGAKADVCRSLTEVAALLHTNGKIEDAITTYRRAEKELAALSGSDAGVRSALAKCRSRMARLLLVAGRSDEALAACVLARADQESIASNPKNSREPRRDLAATALELSVVFWQIGKLPEAEAEVRTALEIQEKLVAEEPALADLRASLGSYHMQLASVLMRSGRLAPPEKEMRRALAIFDKLVAENPSVSTFRSKRASGHVALGNLMLMNGRPSDAVVELRLAQSILEKLADENPTVTNYRDGLASIHSILGLALYNTGKVVDGEAECRRGVAMRQKLIDDSPDDLSRKELLAYDLELLGDAARSHGNIAVAKEAYEQAIALVEPLTRDAPTNKRYRIALADFTWRRGITLGLLGDPAGAATNVRRALKMSDGMTLEHGLDWYNASCCHAALAGLAGAAGSGVSAAEAARAADKAMELLTQSVKMGIRNANEFRIESALDSLRHRADFRLLMMDVAVPDDPFAHGP